MAVTSFLDNLFRRRKKKYRDSISLFEYEFETIRAATNEFSDLIGRGRCGSLYKGNLQSGQEIAVKILCNRYYREFLNEVNLLPKLRHKNLIHLLGFCSEQGQDFLVYEFMPNSSLDQFIFDPCRASQPSWETCRNIFVGIAQGLQYLHEESGLQVVHLDIKPSNILLDEDFNPKITGFEVARQIQDGQNKAESTRLFGTAGYIDLHFHQTLRFSAKNDVYTFGVTILTIITRRRIHSSNEETLIQYALRCWTRGEPINVIHEVMRKEERQGSISEILRFIHIALLCVDVNPDTRPSLDEVLHWFSVSLLLYLNQELVISLL
ncbi:hypothetical protein F2Q70_00003504 [Brassica cretica]|uniref:non-specific serine/threonine protein kinase n=2 Tax=Brassica cretica TaxID=69181 RepID=A0A8S9G3C4_BRACR|nr:hypothetical protein F2Q68_00020981 [Brassica cretica]KAF2570293.1 hypothetical protein F2Q70_00003504 [Brassica cretica]KAF3562741.1 hypothetical protein DY000_02015407 [Brassica cretica]